MSALQELIRLREKQEGTGFILPCKSEPDDTWASHFNANKVQRHGYRGEHLEPCKRTWLVGLRERTTLPTADERRAIMQAARECESARRARLVPVEPMSARERNTAKVARRRANKAARERAALVASTPRKRETVADRLETLYCARVVQRLTIEGVMRHEPCNNSRGSVTRATSSVNATTVSASQRLRVADSHDARAAQDRSTARPYSAAQFVQDIYRQYPNASRSGECLSIRVPVWYLAAVGAERAADTHRHTGTVVTIERERTPRKRIAKVNVKADATARALAIAGTIRMAEQD